MAVRDDRSDVKQTTAGFRGPLMVQSLTSAKSKFLSLMDPCFPLPLRFWNFLFNFNPTNSSIKKNTLNDNRSFIFLSIICTIEKGGVAERYHNG